jgi:miniconductance mechanosensitive channel
VLAEYLAENNAGLRKWNAGLVEQGLDPVNNRQVTNLGTLRACILFYLRHHPDVNQQLTMMVRQSDPGPDGVPSKVYCFSRYSAWIPQEGVQSDTGDSFADSVRSCGIRIPVFRAVICTWLC